MPDRGSMLVLVAFVGVAITAATMLAVTPVLGGMIERQRAQSAADAVALAGVTGGRDAAADVAAANRAEIVAWSRKGRRVTVAVRVGDQTAGARATDAP